MFTIVQPYKVTLHFAHSTLVIACDDFSISTRNGAFGGPLKDIDFKNPTPAVRYFDPAAVLAVTAVRT